LSSSRTGVKAMEFTFNEDSPIKCVEFMNAMESWSMDLGKLKVSFNDVSTINEKDS
jgi:hypothetical protein